MKIEIDEISKIGEMKNSNNRWLSKFLLAEILHDFYMFDHDEPN